MKNGARLSESLDFTVSGPRRPAQALIQDGNEAGDGFSMGAAPHLSCFCHQGESDDHSGFSILTVFIK